MKVWFILLIVNGNKQERKYKERTKFNIYRLSPLPSEAPFTNIDQL